MGVMVMLIFVVATVAAIRFFAMAALERAVARPAAEQIPQGPRAGLRARDPDAPAEADRAERLAAPHRVG